MKTSRIIRNKTLITALCLVMLFSVCSVSSLASSANTNGLTVQSANFRDVLRLYISNPESFGIHAMETDEAGVTNAAKSLAGLFAYTVGLNYTGEGFNYNYFGKDITSKMGTEPYADANLLSSYEVEIFPCRSGATPLPAGQKTELRIYLVGYENASSGVKQVLHYVWQDQGIWYAVKDDNPYYLVSYNGMNASAATSEGVTILQNVCAGGGTAVLGEWASLSAKEDGESIVHTPACTVVAGQGSANLFGVTDNPQTVISEGGYSAALLGLSDFVSGDTTYASGPLVESRQVHVSGKSSLIGDGTPLKAGVKYSFKITYDEALVPTGEWESIGLSVGGNEAGRDTVSGFVWLGDEEYLTDDKYDPHTVMFDYEFSAPADTVCVFSPVNLSGCDSGLAAASVHTCLEGDGSEPRPTEAAAVETAETLAAEEPLPVIEAAPTPAAEPTPAPVLDAPVPEEPTVLTVETTPSPVIETPAPTAVPLALTLATTDVANIPVLLYSGGAYPTDRVMLAEALWTLAGQPASAETVPFSDYPADPQKIQAISWCAENGLIVGYGDGIFAPQVEVSREQAAVILARFARQLGIEVHGFGSLSAFSDGGSVSPWALESMIWAVNTGMLHPLNDGALHPELTVLCGEITEMLTRLVQNS